MKFYYTNSAKPDEPQKEPNKSLGGYISSSVVPNEMQHAMLDNASYLSIKRKQKQIRCFALKNTTGETVSDISLDFEFNEDMICDISIGVATPDEDACGFLFDTIPNDFATPYNIEFTPVEDGESISLTGVTLAPNESVGIWIKRVYKDDTTVEKTCAEVQEEAETPPGTEDTIQITISYSVDESTSQSV